MSDSTWGPGDPVAGGELPRSDPHGPDEPTVAHDVVIDAPSVGAARVAARRSDDFEVEPGPRAVVVDSGVPSLAEPETGDLPEAEAQRRRRRRRDDGYDEDGNLRPLVVATPLAPGFRGVIHPRWVERLFATHDIYGPRVRLGVLWFAAQAVAAIWVGGDGLGALYGLVAAVAALQTCREWRRAYSQPSRLVAALGAGILPISATFGIGAVGLVAFGICGLAVVFALFRRRRRWSRPYLDAVSCTVRSSVFVGVGAAAVVLTEATSFAGVLVLLGLVAAYEVGDFIIGAESAGVLIGPIGGMLAVAACAVPIAVFNIAPFERPEHALVFGGVVAVFCPLSQIAGSLILPSARAWSPALRRLDSLILTAPAWLLLFWGYFPASVSNR